MARKMGLNAREQSIIKQYIAAGDKEITLRDLAQQFSTTEEIVKSFWDAFSGIPPEAKVTENEKAIEDFSTLGPEEDDFDDS